MAFEEHDEETTPLLPTAERSNCSKLKARISKVLEEPLSAKGCIPILTVLNFITGFLDAISYTTLHIWAAFQTGNSLQLSLALSRLITPSSQIPPSFPSKFDYAFSTSDRVAVASLFFFNVGAFFGGYAVNGTTRKTRGWMALSSFIQLVITGAAALLLIQPGQQNVDIDPMRRNVSLVLVAASLGAQGIQAKSLGTSQFGTSLVLTTAWVDLMNSPLKGRLRDHKALPIVSLILGGFVGGTILRYGGIAGALGVVALLRVATIVGWFLVPSA